MTDRVGTEVAADPADLPAARRDRIVAEFAAGGVEITAEGIEAVRRRRQRPTDPDAPARTRAWLDDLRVRAGLSA